MKLLFLLIFIPSLCFADVSATVNTIQNTPPYVVDTNTSAAEEIKGMFQVSLTDFLDTFKTSSIFQILQPIENLTFAGDPVVSFDTVRFGTLGFDFSTWPSLFYAILRGLVLIPCFLLSVRIVTNTK